MDNDAVSITNINRQLVALHSTIGQKKVEVMKKRVLDIAPDMKVDVVDCLINADSVDENNAGSEPNTGSVVEETVHENNGTAVISDESGKQSDDVIVQNGTPAGVQNDVTNEQVEENKSFDGDLPEAAGPSSIPGPRRP